MMVSLLNKFKGLFITLAPSLGGAVLVLIGFDFSYKQGNLFTPKAVEFLFFISLLFFILYVLAYREKKILILLLLLTFGFSLAYFNYRAYSTYSYWLSTVCGLLSLLYLVWYRRYNLPVLLLLSGSLSGMVFSYANFLFLLKPMNFVILMGMALSFLVTKKEYREKKDISVYTYQYFFIVFPALFFILMKYLKHYGIFYFLMFLFVVIGEGLKNMKEE
ncbi:hypothetical protein TTHT_0800 [Thermotomaculum hydrothermale]|uniref:Uncharacterized protein n=1 Tax=Thermotomaculum hydrothermale TaxID=981385 RepID=A0A7R6PQ96_9BACT|nr:hypothetical protein [Thermotomaculum hydrothermale]BBB32366.1 hypothetical protein TTHT_0800 [Thermotomaculum hydrothermale]